MRVVAVVLITSAEVAGAVLQQTVSLAYQYIKIGTRIMAYLYYPRAGRGTGLTVDGGSPRGWGRPNPHWQGVRVNRSLTVR